MTKKKRAERNPNNPRTLLARNTSALRWMLVLCMTLLLCPAGYGAEPLASGSCGSGLTWTLDADGTLTISGKGKLTGYSAASPAPWLREGHADKIRRLVIEEGVTRIEANEFVHCGALESAVIPNSVDEIWTGAFYDCPALKSVTLPGVFSISVYDEASCCFENCGALEELTIASDVMKYFPQYILDKSTLRRVTVAGNATRVGVLALADCPALEEVTLGDGVTEIGPNAFKNCPSLRTVRGGSGVSDFDISAFSGDDLYLSAPGCVLLGHILVKYNSDGSDSLTVPASVTAVWKEAFRNNTDLETVRLPEGLEEIGACAFAGCAALQKINLPEGLEEVGDSAFADCTALREITVPGSVAELGNYAFARCTALERAVLSSGAETLGWYAFSDCTGLVRAELPVGVTRIRCGAFSGCAALEEAELPAGLTVIESRAFAGCAALKEAELPEGLEEVGGNAFEGCAALRSLRVPASVTKLETGAFSDCAGLVEIRLDAAQCDCGSKVFSVKGQPEANCVLTVGSGVTRLSSGIFNDASHIRELRVECPLNTPYAGLFRDMKGLETIVLTGSCPDLGEDAFSGCTALKNVTLPKDLETLGARAFSGCSALEALPLPAGLTDIGESCFQNCAALKQVSLPDSLTRIGGRAFAGCAALEGTERSGGAVVLDGWAIDLYNGDGSDLVLPAGTVGTADSLAEASGADIGAFTRLLLPEGLRIIGKWSFAYMYSLESVSLPASLLRLGDRAFYGCGKLTAVEGSPAHVSVGENAFSGTPFAQSQEFLILGDTLVSYQGSGKAEVTIPEGVTVIGSRALAGHEELTRVLLPAGLKEVGQEAFHACSALAEVRLPEGLEAIGPEAFGWTGLTEITVPGSVTAVSDRAFIGCPSMETAVLEEGVTELGEYAFGGCEALKRVSLPRSLQRMGTAAFAGTALTEADLPAGTVLGDRAFADSALENLTFDGEPANFLPLVRRYGQVLRGTPLQKTVLAGWYGEDAPGDWYTENALTFLISRVYARSLLERGEVSPNTLSIYDWMCANCGYIYATGQGPSTADGPFFNGVASCNGVALAMECLLDEAGCPNFIMEGYVTGSYGRVRHAWNEVGPGGFYIVDATDTKKGDYSTYMIDNFRANQGFSSGGLNIHYEFSMDTLYAREEACLEKYSPVVTSAQPLTFTPQADGGCWVTDCENVAGTVQIPGEYEGRLVTGVGPGAFADCVFLTRVTIPEGVVSIGNEAFRGCLGLEEIVLPSTVKTLGSGVFENCVSLERADFSASGLTRLPEGTFSRCVSLWELRLPDSLTDASGMKVPSGSQKLVNSTDGTWCLDVYGYSGGAAEKKAAELGCPFHSLGQHDTVRDGAALLLHDVLGGADWPLPGNAEDLDINGDGRADRKDAFRMIFDAFPEEGEGVLSRLVIAMYDTVGQMTGILVLRDEDMATEQDFSVMKNAAEVRMFFLNSETGPLREAVTARLTEAS